MPFTIERIKSFLAKRRLPQFGHEANKDTYSVSLVLFQLWEHDKHFIFHPLFDPEAFHAGTYKKKIYYGDWLMSGIILRHKSPKVAYNWPTF